MKCCNKRDDLFVVRNGKFVKYTPPTEKFRIDVLNIYLDISKALDLMGSWDMEEVEWDFEQIKYYLNNIAIANMKYVEDPNYSEPDKTLIEIGSFDYKYPDTMDVEKLSAPGILLPKNIVGSKYDVIVDGNHRLIRYYRDKKPMKMKILTNEQYKEISI